MIDAYAREANIIDCMCGQLTYYINLLGWKSDGGTTRTELRMVALLRALFKVFFLLSYMSLRLERSADIM